MDGRSRAKLRSGPPEHFTGKGVDFDFMDFESLARPKSWTGTIHVSGEIYRVLVLPAMESGAPLNLAEGTRISPRGSESRCHRRLCLNQRTGWAAMIPRSAAMSEELFLRAKGKTSWPALPGRDYEGPGGHSASQNRSARICMPFSMRQRRRSAFSAPPAK